MMRSLSILAIASMATGPLPMATDEGGRTLTMSLCNGGEITIPIGDDRDKDPRDCKMMACHAVTCREKNKRSTKSI